MDKETYRSVRSSLVTDYYRCLKLRLWLCARARVRKIAALDFEQEKIPVEVTKQLFDYNKIGQRNGTVRKANRFEKGLL